jgi:hypothetical protein
MLRYIFGSSTSCATIILCNRGRDMKYYITGTNLRSRTDIRSRFGIFFPGHDVSGTNFGIATSNLRTIDSQEAQASNWVFCAPHHLPQSTKSGEQLSGEQSSANSRISALTRFARLEEMAHH